MTIPHTLDVAGRPDPHDLLDVLPHGWQPLPIPGVDRTVIIGPGGVIVLVTRAAPGTPSSRPAPQPWNGSERRRPTSAQTVAELVSQLLSDLCDRDLPCHPVVVLADDDTRLVARLDDVPVLHRRRLSAWLERQPNALDRFTIGNVVETVTGIRRTSNA